MQQEFLQETNASTREKDLEDENDKLSAAVTLVRFILKTGIVIACTGNLSIYPAGSVNYSYLPCDGCIHNPFPV